MKLTEKQKSEAVIQFSGKSLGQMVRKKIFFKKQSFSNRIVHSQKNHKKRNLQKKHTICTNIFETFLVIK